MVETKFESFDKTLRNLGFQGSAPPLNMEAPNKIRRTTKTKVSFVGML